MNIIEKLFNKNKNVNKQNILSDINLGNVKIFDDV